MSAQEYLARMKTIAREGGKIARELVDQSQPSFKKDGSVVTLADKKVSRLAQEILQDLLKTPEHILIDEEDPVVERYFDQPLLEKTPFVWALDPIDGTRNYANRMPNFGISIGVLKDLRPWLGVVYFPALQELFYSDGKEAFFVQQAFSSEERTTKIPAIDQPITGQSVFLCIDNFAKKFEWDYQDCHLMTQACAAVDLCWPAIGRGGGAFFKSSLWDFVGPWPIVTAAGLNFRSLASGKILDRIQVDLFLKENTIWKLREPYILSSERNFSILKSKIRPRE